MYLPIKVNGRGLIPRGHGLAPKSFVKADEQLVQLIMQTAGLSMEYIHPETNGLIPITRTNYRELFASHEAYLNAKNNATSPSKTNVNPVTAPPVTTPVNPVTAPVTNVTPEVEKKEEVKKEEVKEDKKEEKKEFTMKPIHKEDKK